MSGNSMWRFALASLALALSFGACSTQTSAPVGNSNLAGSSSFATAPHDRPGLGTKWGETLKSASRDTNFVRADPKRPLATAEIFYNDRTGIEAMAAAAAFRRVWPVLSGPASSLISIGLKDQSGRFLPGLTVGGRWFVIGEEGRRYSIAVRNRSDLRLEVVLSVDGLDVLDGRSASIHKRGYVIDPHRTLVVAGFRQSAAEIAAFRFSSVRESYAHEKYGNSRNVGVIGVALFNERGTYPWTDYEVRKRLRANPFPNHFATPPNE